MSKIDYSPAFTKVMGYFRRVLVDGGHSERSLLLSKSVIEHNAANYTAWQYRRTCLKELHKGSSAEQRRKAWEDEKAYCTEQCTNNPKNYQVWFHRRACVLGMSEAAAELKLATTQDAIESSTSSPRSSPTRTRTITWATGRVLQHSAPLAAELDFVDALLESDLRNNSAWNQRYFVLQHTADLASADLVSREIDYALRYIQRALSNASPWSTSRASSLLSASRASLRCARRARLLGAAARPHPGGLPSRAASPPLPSSHESSRVRETRRMSRLLVSFAMSWLLSTPSASAFGGGGRRVCAPREESAAAEKE